MLSSMTPTFMLGPEKVVVLGGKGGSRIITMVLLGMLGIEQGLAPEQVVAQPRFHQQYLPDTIYAEPGAFTDATAAALRAMGYRITQGDKPWEYYVHIVDWDRRSNTLHGGADPRNPVGSATVVQKMSRQAEPAR
jgi:gamma-glutamyltranspeptidase/glutathione hydrolase